MLTTHSYTLSSSTALPYVEAVERVRAELKNAGFGVLCEIDVQATLREKLGVEQEPYLILGACNPPLAHQALAAEPELGVLQRSGIVARRKQGNFAYYRIVDEGVLSLCEAVCGSLQRRVESLHELVGGVSA